MLTFKTATVADIKTIQSVAYPAFTDAYKTILTPEQTAYMLNMMYSEKSLTEQMQNGHIFFIAFDDEKPCGYVSVEKQNEHLFHLQKIYLLKECRGKGFGKILFEKAQSYALSQCTGECVMELNVNRNNKALEFYKKMGMHIAESGDFNIGGGFYMNDYIMRKKLR